jgi:hypothetical protein
MKREVDQAMPLLFRQSDEIGEQYETVREPTAPAHDDEQFGIGGTKLSRRLAFRGQVDISSIHTLLLR